jgi:uncharacterized membrane protein YkoI
MTHTKRLTLAIAGVLAAATLSAAGAADAKDRHDQRTNEAAIIANAKVTITQAIATAEQQTGGKAVGTGIEDQDGAVFLEVTVLKDNQKHKVLIDPQSGHVVKAVLEDNDEGEDEDD